MEVIAAALVKVSAQVIVAIGIAAVRYIEKKSVIRYYRKKLQEVKSKED
jgi:hypothetical protein